MDQKEAINLLRGGPSGVKQWNELRKAGAPIPDLSGAHLSLADLSLADLSNTDLCKTDLSQANLCEAALCGSNLVEANIAAADCFEADLNGANLHKANLVGTYLSGAYLSETNFDHTIVGWTVFGDVDLSYASNLDTVSHSGPSTIGIDTLYRSKGKIPAVFLRGCGVPDALIEYLPSLLGSPDAIQFYSCFISHSSKDHEFCQRLQSRMRDKGLRVWFAPEDIEGGKKIHDQVFNAIRFHDKLLLVLSEHSMDSEWVQTELRSALEREAREQRRVLFPIRLCSLETIKAWKCFNADTGKDMAREVREYHIPVFQNWKHQDEFEKAFKRLLSDLKADDPPINPDPGE